MSDHLSPRELSDAFKYLLAYQLDSIAEDGVMPSAHGALHKLLCSCYSKDTEVIEYDGSDGTDRYVKTSSKEPAENNNLPPPRSPIPPEPKKESKKQKSRKEEKSSSPIIVEVFDDTPNSKMMLSTVNNPYRDGGSSSNTSNHRMVIEDVTDDPEYSSYGNENRQPENEEEGAFVEYEKLDKTEDPAAFKVGQSTTAVNRSYSNIRPSYRMPIGSGSIGREMRFDSMVLDDVEDGARCRDKECRLGWKQHPWRYD